MPAWRSAGAAVGCDSDAVDWQAVGTIAAMLGVIASFFLTVRGQRQERAIAEASAARSEAAARLTEEYTARVVEALEQMAAGVGVGGSRVAAAVVRWSVTKASGDIFRLENEGSATAYNVTIEGHQTLVGPDVIGGDVSAVGSGEAVLFVAAMSLATSDATITVSWASPADATDRQTWRYPLPF